MDKELPPQEAASSTEDAPPTQKGGAPSLPTYTDLMALAVDDLASTAVSIRSDQFRKDGIGALGNMFRLLSASKDTPAEEEYWSQVLELASKLWDAEFRDASLKLLKDANLRLTPPNAFKDHFTDSIAFGEDYTLFLKAQVKFDQGDDEGAASCIAQMSAANRHAMQSQLNAQGAHRKKSRKTAFLAAAGLGLILSIGVVFAVGNFIDFIKNPPKYKLPEFNMETALPDFDFGQSGVDASTPIFVSEPSPDGTQDALETLVSPSDLIEESDSLGTDIPAEPSREQTSTPSDLIFPTNDIASGEVNAVPISPAESTETLEKVRPDAEKIYNCALAFRVSAVATRMANISESEEQIGKAKKFTQTFFAACGELGIPVEELQKVAETIEDRTVENFATTILISD